VTRANPKRSSWRQAKPPSGNTSNTTVIACPAEIPAKREYIFRDAYRKAHRVGITLKLPPTHPFNPLVALRVASLMMEAAPKRQLIDALYAATWREATGIETPEAVAAVAKSIGLDGEALVHAAQKPAAKERLRTATDDALARGVFGVPTVRASKETFWGTDGDEMTPGNVVPAQTRVNGRVTWVAPDQQWEASLFCTNCTDVRVTQSTIDFLNLFGSLQQTYIDPEEWGISIKRRFD